MIDDDDDFRHALADNLRDDGHEVIEARSPADLPPLGQLQPASALIFADQAEQGLPFCDHFHRQHVTVPIIFITPYRTAILDREARARKFLTVVCKPLDYEELHNLLATPTASH